MNGMIIKNERKKYASDITDSQWAIIKPLQPKAGNKSKWEKRELINRPLAKINIQSKIKDMKYEKIVNYSGSKFRRITGVKRSTFEKKVEILKKGYASKHQRRGRHQKLSIEDLLLATLEYLREYRTYAHIAASYDIAESNIYRGIRWVEDTLIKDGTFSLPGRKALLKSDVKYKVILVDATETPIERPQKNKENTTQERKNVIP